MEETERRNAALAEEVRIATTQTRQDEVNSSEVQNLIATISGLEAHIREVERANGALIEDNQALSSRMQQNEGSGFEVKHLKSVISQLESHIQEVERNNVSLIDEIRSLSIKSQQPHQDDVYLIENQRMKEAMAMIENDRNKVYQ
jgi:predicted RNase H-like nuclease (RuvC/YqgF family)